MKINELFFLNPEKNTNKYTDFINYIDTSSVLEGKLTNIQLLDSDFPSRANRLIQKNDILYSSVRPNLKHYYFYTDEYSHCVASTGFIILRKKEKAEINEKFVYYYLSTNTLCKHFSNIAELSQTTFPSISAKDIAKIEIPNLSIFQQSKIANILSRYDEAIENNNKRIKLLEQMAQNLYKEWFVRFRFPGWENCEFENGIPVGWKVEKLGNFCKITDGTHDTPAQVEEGIPLVTGKAIRNGRIDFSIPYNISVEDHEKIKKRSGLKTGDILFSNIGTIGNVCLVNYDREFSVKNMIIFKPESINQSMYLFYLLNSDSIQSLFTAQTNGASQQFLGLDFMRRFKILLPSEEIIKLFGEKEVLIIQQINIFQQQNQNLAKQRDLLLPRLMSGKIEVKYKRKEYCTYESNNSWF